MRRLAQPEVVTSAMIGAAASTVLCLPRFLLWEKRPFPLLYLEATVFFTGFVLWAFVFAWHTEYTGRPVFTLNIKPLVFVVATLVGIAIAMALHYFLDPTFRSLSPEEYPADFKHWIASTLFGLAFADVFLIFAAYAWVMRLFRNENVAMSLTIILGVGVWFLKFQTLPHPLPAGLFFNLLLSRVFQVVAAVWVYSRGGILPVWWLGLLIEARHLLNL